MIESETRIKLKFSWEDKTTQNPLKRGRAMKKLIILIILLIFPAFAIAGDLSYSDKRKLREAGYSRSDIRKIEREIGYKYKGTAGTKYKYA